jgi:hypothetical protein
VCRPFIHETWRPCGLTTFLRSFSHKLQSPPTFSTTPHYHIPTQILTYLRPVILLDEQILLLHPHFENNFSKSARSFKCPLEVPSSAPFWLLLTCHHHTIISTRQFGELHQVQAQRLSCIARRDQFELNRLMKSAVQWLPRGKLPSTCLTSLNSTLSSTNL